jgi:hypothetical protein
MTRMKARGRRSRLIQRVVWLVLAPAVFSTPLAAAHMTPALSLKSGSPSPWGWNIAMYAHQSDIKHSAIESRLADFQSNTELSGGPHAAFLVGVRRHATRLELDIYVARNDLADFLDPDHYFYVLGGQVLLWYRRELPIELGPLKAGILPGVGIGYSSAIATVGCDADHCRYKDNGTIKYLETDLLEAGALTFGLGVRLELELFGRQSRLGTRRHSFDLGMDYSYRFPDMSAKSINEGDIFFPTPTEFAVSGHYIALGLQYTFAALSR